MTLTARERESDIHSSPFDAMTSVSVFDDGKRDGVECERIDGVRARAGVNASAMTGDDDDEDDVDDVDDDDDDDDDDEEEEEEEEDDESSSSSEGYGFGRESADVIEAMERLVLEKSNAKTMGEALRGRAPPRALESFDVAGVARYVTRGKATNVVVMTGAGVSVSAGIPDFRSEKGLYSRLGEYDLPYPQAVFEIDYFRAKPRPFYRLAKDLLPGTYRPTPTHHFIKLLHDKGILLRCYTQNIDSLERAAGLPTDKVVAAHGNFDSAKCLRGHRADVCEVEKACREGEPMRCHCGELVKPDIVFFGENLPERFGRCAADDFEKCDLLIVIGTSLVVHPFAGLIERPHERVPRLLINLEKVGEAPNTRITRLYSLAGLGRGTGFNFDPETNYRDALYLGDCDEGIRALADALGWKDDLEKLIAEGSAE